MVQIKLYINLYQPDDESNCLKAYFEDTQLLVPLTLERKELYNLGPEIRIEFDVCTELVKGTYKFPLTVCLVG